MTNNPNLLHGQKLPSESKTLPTGIYPPGPMAPAGIFSIDAHENLIISKGFKALHFRHALNPVRNTTAEGVNLKQMDLTGMVYYDPKEFYIVPQNLKWEESYLVIGVHGKHTTTINHTGKYTDTGERVYLRPGDIIALTDSSNTVMMEDLFEFDPSGVQKLNFPAYSIDYLSDGARRYEEGVDFILQDGNIQWLNPQGSTNPSFNLSKMRGTVFSCVFWTKPYFVVVDTPRIFRMVWANEYANAGTPADAIYLPGSAVLAMAWLSPAGYGKVNWPKIV